MAKDYLEITKRISTQIGTLRKDIEPVMSGFSQLSSAAKNPKSLDQKTVELITLAIAVATRCDGCIGFHMKALIDLKATKEEVEEVLGVAIYMGGGPSLMYAADAMLAFDQFSKN